MFTNCINVFGRILPKKNLICHTDKLKPNVFIWQTITTSMTYNKLSTMPYMSKEIVETINIVIFKSCQALYFNVKANDIMREAKENRIPE